MSEQEIKEQLYNLIGDMNDWSIGAHTATCDACCGADKIMNRCCGIIDRAITTISHLQAEIEELKQLQSENKELRRVLGDANTEIERLRKAMKDLIFTAQKLWNDTPKSIMSNHTITVTHRGRRRQNDRARFR